ncbi:MAG: PIG-L family deacetylase [Candidatus Staskawiczbacteria bacterium]|nr:PIG-L family deacetylase [Candidatus Staskawiczbacteria bacterium]
MKKILVVAPHPDDEVLGCGGTIKKHTKSGDDVYLCLITRPLVPDWSEDYINNKDKEIKASNDFLGFKEVFFLDLPSLRLDTVPKKDINDKLIEIVGKIKPEILYIPFWGDINHDHQIVSESSLIAGRPKPGSSIKKIFAYEISTEKEWGGNKTTEIKDIFLPNYYEDISNYLNDKLKAMECYKSELKEYPHPRSLKGIEVLAQKRGMDCGLKAAEAFILIRQINK